MSSSEEPMKKKNHYEFHIPDPIKVAKLKLRIDEIEGVEEFRWLSKDGMLVVKGEFDSTMQKLILSEKVGKYVKSSKFETKNWRSNLENSECEGINRGKGISCNSTSSESESESESEPMKMKNSYKLHFTDQVKAFKLKLRIDEIEGVHECSWLSKDGIDGIVLVKGEFDPRSLDELIVSKKVNCIKMHSSTSADVLNDSDEEEEENTRKSGDRSMSGCYQGFGGNNASYYDASGRMGDSNNIYMYSQSTDGGGLFPCYSPYYYPPYNTPTGYYSPYDTPAGYVYSQGNNSMDYGTPSGGYGGPNYGSQPGGPRSMSPTTRYGAMGGGYAGDGGGNGLFSAPTGQFVGSATGYRTQGYEYNTRYGRAEQGGYGDANGNLGYGNQGWGTDPAQDTTGNYGGHHDVPPECQQQ